MDLLPRTTDEFTRKDYWDDFFTKLKDGPFEWYGEYNELSNLLHKYISQKDKLLIVGCGNSTLSVDLFAAGIKNQVNVDISNVVVKQMSQLHPHIHFEVQDVTKMGFEDESFSCVFDKGTFDALAPAKVKESDEVCSVDFMLNEIGRVLKQGGRFLCVSLLQSTVARRLFTYFHSNGWMIRLARCYDAEKKNTEDSPDSQNMFPVFMGIFTKLKLPAGITPIIEVMKDESSTSFDRLSSLEQLFDFIREIQNLAQMKKSLRKIGFCSEKSFNMKLVTKAGIERFSIFVVDVLKFSKSVPLEKNFGVFLVPQGRETEWLFGSHEGRVALSNETGFARLAVVHLIRGQTYESTDKIQEEIHEMLNFFSPASILNKKIKIPIMTMGNDVGDRKILLEGTSIFSGNYVVEDVTVDQKTFRRLIFLNNLNVIQSEVEIDIGRKRGREFKNQITSKLCCVHHEVMALAFGLLTTFFKVTNMKSLLVGLGGGLLPSFLVSFLPQLKLVTVELDPEIPKIAKEFFGLKESDRLSIVVDDGLNYIKTTKEKFNVILIDVDNKSVKEGLSCPPDSFLEKENLEAFKAALDPTTGIFVLNLVCRNNDLKRQILSSMTTYFPFIYTYDIADEVNVILFCFMSTPSGSQKSFGSLLNESVAFINRSRTAGGNTTKREKKENAKLEKEKGSKDLFDGEGLISHNFKLLKI